jgi:ribosomal protein L3 glutamine methyltransferase
MSEVVTLEQMISRVEGELERTGMIFGQGSDDAWQEAVWLCLFAAGIEPSAAEPDWKLLLDRAQQGQVLELLQRRIDTRQPLAYLINEAWFGAEKFYVDERVIIPRSYLVEWIPEGFEPWIDRDALSNILDLCTGCGCIAILAAKHFGTASVVASDISGEALEVAAVNVQQHGLEQRVQLHRGDGFEGLQQKFDLILCNPPYVSRERMERLPEEFQREPGIAFAGGDDGLDFISRILLQAREYLSDDGALVLEAGSASHALEQRYPRIPFNWLSTEYDEMVVFLITAGELDQYRGKLEAGFNQS